MDWKTPQVNKEIFIALASAYIKDENYINELYDISFTLADKYEIVPDFIGLSYNGGNLFSIVLDLLGDDFSYWFYECKQSFDTFNNNIKLSDGISPKVNSMEDLWEFANANKE